MTQENFIIHLQSIYRNAHNANSINNLTSFNSEEYLQEQEKTSRGGDRKPSPSEIIFTRQTANRTLDLIIY